MSRFSEFYPEQLTGLDQYSISFGRAKDINPDGNWRFALWRPRGGIGDILMLTPTFRAIKETFPNSTLTFITSFAYLSGALKEVLWGNPHLDKLVDVRHVNNEYLKKFDVVGDMDCPCVKQEVPGRMPANRIDLFAWSLGLNVKNPRPVYAIKPEEEQWLKDFKRKRQWHSKSPIIMYQPFSSSQKRSPTVTASKHILAALARHWPDSNIYVPTHKTDWAPDANFNLLNCEQLENWDVRLIGALMRGCDVVIAQDSSLLHLAGALDVPLVGIFGPTPPHCRLNYYPKSVAIHLGAHCNIFPCWYSNCPAGLACWKHLEEKDVILATERALNGDYTKFSKPSKIQQPGSIAVEEV